jgi:hypothetical protein
MRKPSWLEQYLALRGKKFARAANVAEAHRLPAPKQAALFWDAASVWFAAAIEAKERGRRAICKDYLVAAKGWARKAIDADQGIVVEQPGHTENRDLRFPRTTDMETALGGSVSVGDFNAYYADMILVMLFNVASGTPDGVIPLPLTVPDLSASTTMSPAQTKMVCSGLVRGALARRHKGGFVITRDGSKLVMERRPTYLGQHPRLVLS